MYNSIVDIYVRLSDEDRDKKNRDDESESILNQKRMLTDYCAEHGWTVNAVYCDENYSGTDPSRPGWRQLLSDCEEKRCNTVLCKTMSRFSRDMEMIEKYIHGKFREWGIRFVSIVDNGDTDMIDNKKSRQINGLINEWYLDDLSRNIKATLSAKRKNGQFVGSFAPYGYIVDPKDRNHLVIDPPAAETVRRIFSMYIDGSGYIAIAKALNRDGISPPCERKKELGLNYRNMNFERSGAKKLWTDSAVYTVIRRREYTGTVIGGRQTVVNYKTGVRQNKPETEWDSVRDMHEAIISEDIFDTAQSIRLSRGRGCKIPDGKCYPLSRRVYCGECGNSMWKTSYEVSGVRHSYLSCRTRKTSGECGNIHQMRCDLLEEAILEQLNLLLKKYYDKALIGSINMPCDMTSRDRIINEIGQHKAEIAKCRCRMSIAYNDKLDGVISSDEYLRYCEGWKDTVRRCTERISELERRPEYTGDAALPDEDAIKEKFRQIDKLELDTVNQFIDKIIVYGLKSNGTRAIRIVWKI